MRESGRRPKTQLPTDATTEQQVIEMEDGWSTIVEVGITPFFERVETLEQAKFSHKNIPRDQFLRTYDTIFTMCIQREPYNFSERLYNKHTESLTQYFKERFIPTLSKAQGLHGVAFLKAWVKRWRCCQAAVDGMCRMFMYLDRFYVPNSEDLLTTSEQGYTLYREHVFKRFRDTSRNAVLECIEKEREKEEQDRELLRDCIKVFVELGSKLAKVDLLIYKEHFQTELISETRKWYKGKSREWLDSSSCPEYLKLAEDCVKKEENRLALYIHKSSKDELMRATRDELLMNHQEELLNKDSGIDRMLERTQGGEGSTAVAEAKEDLFRLFRLYEQVEQALGHIAKAVKVHVCKLGTGFINKSQELAKQKGQTRSDKNHELITNLIKLHNRFLCLVKDSFRGDQLFHKALKEAFEEFINMSYFTSNYLARFANDILRKGGHAKTLMEQNLELEKTMDNVVTLYGYIRDKDIFERDYQTYLSSRLLQDLSESEHAEKSMIGKLKTESGYHWTSKLEDMFKDIQRSKELMSEFNNAYRHLDIELSVSVCTTGAWPSNSIVECQMPAELITTAEKYKNFYSKLHSGRKLDYRMDLGKAEVQVHFTPNTKKILVVSTYQMMVLLLFNKKKVLKFKEIQEASQIPLKDLAWHILSLAHPKVKVLKKNPNSKKIEDDHRFGINAKYKNARARVMIPLMAKPQEDDPGAEERKQILFLRQHQMDAAVVRIMKARKSQTHNELVQEVTRQLNNRFTPSPNDIKKRIACLIDQEYIVRDKKERARYHYKM
jgi:cullin 1